MLGDTLTRALICMYTQLLKLYPGRFREEFAREMGDVFDKALSSTESAAVPSIKRRVKMAGLFLREIWYFPKSYLDARHYQLSLNASEAPAGVFSFTGEDSTEAWVGRRASWSEGLVGALPFLLFGLVHLLQGYAELNGYFSLVPRPLAESIEQPYRAYKILSNTVRYAPVAVYFIVALGFLAGWLRSFPRWSYVYLGMAFYFGWYYFNGRYYGVRYGPWAWLPLIAAAALALMLTRSLRPLSRLAQGVWNDWTRLSFALYAFAVPLATIVFFEVDWEAIQLYELLFDTLLLAAGAVAFLRCRTTWGRVLSLEGVVLILVVKGMLFRDWLPIFDQDLPAVIRSLFLFMLIFFGYLLLPSLIGLLRRGVNLLLAR
jgi:hypothetical protein